MALVLWGSTGLSREGKGGVCGLPVPLVGGPLLSSISPSKLRLRAAFTIRVEVEEAVPVIQMGLPSLRGFFTVDLRVLLPFLDDLRGGFVIPFGFPVLNLLGSEFPCREAVIALGIALKRAERRKAIVEVYFVAS